MVAQSDSHNTPACQVGADTFLTISEDSFLLLEAVSTAAHLGKRGHRGKLQYHSLTSTQGLMLMPGQGLRDSRDSRDRGLGPGLTQQGLGDSRDRDLGTWKLTQQGLATSGTLGLTQRGSDLGLMGRGLVIKLRKLCSFVSTNGTFHTFTDNYYGYSKLSQIT